LHLPSSSNSARFDGEQSTRRLPTITWNFF
jgi:hypothetical protein